MQQSTKGTPVVTVNATTSSEALSATSATIAASPPAAVVASNGGGGGGVASTKQQHSPMEHSTDASSLSGRASISTKVLERISFTSHSQHSHSHQSSTATSSSTIVAPVITVVAPSSQSQQATDMISSQPVVVQVSANSQYITVEVPNDTSTEATVNPTSVSADEQDDQANHPTFEDYGSVFSNGSNSAGQISFYTTESYPQAYYNAAGVNIPGTEYMVMDSAATNEHNLALGSNCVSQHRENNQNEDYNKNFQQPRMSVQPQTMAWLLENYENADGVSLPRSTLYSHYLEHCRHYNMEPVNAASFGKLIRSVFLGLRTRRLGTRGNSKYHYYGIRVKPGSSLGRNADGVNGNSDSGSGPPLKRSKNSQHNSSKCESILTIPSASSTVELIKHLGDSRNILSTYWPRYEASENDKLTTKFIILYRAHYERIIKVLAELRFNEVEFIWRSFWQAPPASPECLDIDCLKNLAKTPALVGMIEQIDYNMYNALITHLFLPDLLKPIPQVLTQQIRNFAKCISKWMLNALEGYSDDFIRIKTSAVSALSHMLRRYTSLNHLSSAAQAVLINPTQVAQMISDLNRVDFKNVQEQAAWVCQCDDELVHKVENSFKEFLQGPNPAEQWSCWCELVLKMCLSSPSVASAKDFFFKWEFYSSLVMRDLTLRSAASFGSFHLIRLLYDEYIFYLIEQRIAKATGTTPLQMLGGNGPLILNPSDSNHRTSTTSMAPPSSVASTAVPSTPSTAIDS